jgi:hypothetical protein
MISGKPETASEATSFVPQTTKRRWTPLFGHPGETVAGKLRSLIRVEDLRRSVAAQGFLEGLVAKVLRVLEKRQDRILRLCQFMTATRYINPRAMET